MNVWRRENVTFCRAWWRMDQAFFTAIIVHRMLKFSNEGENDFLVTKTVKLEKYPKEN
jgi:hypothetical protein